VTDRLQTGLLSTGMAALSCVAAHAQQVPVASAEDSRIAILHYAPGVQSQLHAIAGAELTVLLPRGEHVQKVTVGDPGAVRVVVPGDQDGIIVSALRPLNNVSLTVETEQQVYAFTLMVSYEGQVPWIVRIQRGAGMVRSIFPSAPISGPPAASRLPPGEWSIKGDKALQPVMIRDDGAKVSIQWSGTQAIPAVFALDDRGQEQMVNGYMRGDVFVIDRIFEHLVFRIDKATVHADRAQPKPGK